MNFLGRVVDDNFRSFQVPGGTATKNIPGRVQGHGRKEIPLKAKTGHKLMLVRYTQAILSLTLLLPY